MKIIKKGKIPPPETYQGTCRYCGTEIECKPDEVKRDYDQRDGTSWDTVDCPLCKCSINVSKIKKNYR